MAVRRTGMFEAPSNVVSVQRVASPVGNTTGVWADLTRLAERASTALQPLKNQQAERQAQRDFSDGRVGLRLQLNAEDEIYNNAMTQSYLLATSRDLDQRILEIETEHAADAQGFATAFQGVRSAALANAPNDLAPHLEELLNVRETETVSRIGERVRNAGIQAYAQNASARLQQLEARLTGFDDVNSPEYQRAFREYTEVGRALVANPLSGITTEEWDFRWHNTQSRLMADQVARTAELMYVDGGGTAEAAQRALAFVEEQTNNPDLVLTEAQRDASFNEARRRIGQMEAERRRSERELAAQIRAHRAESNNEARDLMAGAQAMAQSFVVIPDDEMAEIASAVSASGSAARAREFNELAIENAVRSRLQGLSQTDIESEVRLYREYAARGDSDAAIALQEAERYRDNLRRVDAVTGLQMHYGEAPASISDGQRIDLRPRVRQMEDYSRSVGRDQPSYFTPGERAALQGMANADPEQAIGVVRQIVSDAAAERTTAPGQGRTRALTMLGELFGEDAPEWLALGGVYLNGGEASMTTVRQMAAASHARRQEGFRAAALRPQGLADGIETEIIEREIGAMRRNMMTDADMVDLRLAADLAYQGRALSDPSVYADSASFRRAYEGAVISVLGGVRRQDANRNWQSWGGSVSMGRSITQDTPYGRVSVENRVVIPNWVRRDRFPQVWRSLRLDDFSAGSLTGSLPNAGNVNDWRNARLVPMGPPGQYALANENGALFTDSTDRSRPYIIDINRIRASLAERQSDAVLR